MARPRSQTAQRGDAASGKGRIASPHRRVTRSQSRELEGLPVLQGNHSARNQSNSHGGHSKWGRSADLDPVVEESPVRSPQKPSFCYGNSIPESPEDVANISGTTILPSEPETDLEPEMMLEALPDLERAGKGVLDFLVPNSSDPVSIVNSAKRLSDPRNTQNRRLGRLMSNLGGEAKYFGHQTYINAEHICRVFSSALANRRRGAQKDWTPSPILHLANCARFAFETLLANVGTSSQRQAIRNVDNLFPQPFMDDLVSESPQKNAGESSLDKDTFELALEIRTQSLIMLLEEHQKEHDFNPMTAVRHSFFLALSVDAPLRGFNLRSLGGVDGELPVKYRDTVQDRFNEILLSQMEDGSMDIDELKGAYRWQRFVLRAAQWARKRNEEIRRALRGQLSAQDVHDAFFSSKPPSFDSTVAASDMDQSQKVGEEETETTPSPIQEDDMRPTLDSADQRSSSRRSFLNSSSIQRIMKRQERLRSVAEDPNKRRQSDTMGSFSQGERDQSPPTPRRQTMPAFLTGGSTQLEEPREMPHSPEGSPTLLHDEPDIFVGEESNFDIGEKEHTQLEKSYSPPVRNTGARHLQQDDSHADPALALSKEVWNAIKTGSLPESSGSVASRGMRSAFIDRQPNAQRVSPISQDVRSQTAVQRVESRVSKKRTRDALEEESENEDSFFTYDSPVDLNRRRSEKPQQNGSKRLRLINDEEAAEEEEEEGHPEDDLNRSSHFSSVHPISTQQSTARRHVSWVRTNAGRDSVASVRSSQMHQRWTPAEDQRLVRLITEFGCGWAQIARQNEAQPVRRNEARIEGRNQVQLKDRARNLKIKYLREQTELPKNFEMVTMKAKDYEMLEKRGITVPRP